MTRRYMTSLLYWKSLLKSVNWLPKLSETTRSLTIEMSLPFGCIAEWHFISKKKCGRRRLTISTMCRSCTKSCPTSSNCCFSRSSKLCSMRQKWFNARSKTLNRGARKFLPKWSVRLIAIKFPAWTSTFEIFKIPKNPKSRNFIWVTMPSRRDTSNSASGLRGESKKNK